MGDIFRRNAFNLGLHVVQCPEAVDDAQDGDAFAFDPATRAADERNAGARRTSRCRSRRRRRRSAGQRRHLRRRPPRVPRLGATRRREIDLPDAETARAHDDDRADRVGAPRRQGRRASRRARRCASTPTCCRRPTARRRSRSTRSTRSPAATRSIRARPRSPTTTSSSPARTTTTARPAIGREFARVHGIEKPYYATPGDGIFHFYFPEQGLVLPGAVHPRRRLAQPRVRRVRRGGLRRRLHDARLRLVDRLHLLHARASSAASSSRAGCSPWVSGQGHRPRAAAALGREAVAGDVGRVRRRRPAAPDRVPQHDRQHDGGGRGAERHLRAGRDHRRVVPREGNPRAALSRASRPGADARVRDRRDARRSPTCADDREAVLPRQRVSRRGGRARAASRSTRR